MQRSIDVYLRSTEVDGTDDAHYAPKTTPDPCEIHLGVDCSKRDDDSIFSILHEFGHAVDNFTTDSGTYHLSNTYDANSKKWINTNHYGLLNPNMNDSYTEGFATFFAALVKKYTNRPHPEQLDRINLSLYANNYAYTHTSPRYSYEEKAIASFLFHAEAEVDDIGKFWSALKPSCTCFEDYVSAILKLVDSQQQEYLKSIAFYLGLYSMPIPGNGVYDEGEPYNDVNRNGQYDDGEAYYDLPFLFSQDVTTREYVRQIEDESKWLDNESNIVYGRVADYARHNTRWLPPYPELGYLDIGTLSGVTAPEYYLVTINSPVDGTYTSLRSTKGGKLFLFDPNVTNAGTVTVSVPGGGTIFTSDMTEIAKRAFERGKDEPAAIALVTSDKLAPDTAVPMPTHGSPTASGYIDFSKKSGDVDGDGQITSADALVILRMSVGTEAENLALADVDGDGQITSADALAVLRTSAGADDGGKL